VTGVKTGVRTMGLTVRRIAKLTKPGRYLDGHGLYLQVGHTGARSWLLRYVQAGNERWLGLGPLHTFTLDEARQRAVRARQQIHDGIDPIALKRAARDTQALERAKALTFEQATKQYFDQHSPKWSNARHREQFVSMMQAYAYPVIGKLPVATIDTGLILQVIEPIWTTKNQTAIRLRGRIESVLDWATVRGYRTGENPARWKGHLAEVLPASSHIAKVKHFTALPYTQAPAFVAQLATLQGIGPKALEFLILTAGRTDEVLSARWSEINLDEALWTIPPERMKEGAIHRVPLTERAIEILRALPREGDLVFLSSKPGRPMGKMTFLKLIKAMGYDDITTHGFRSCFRDFAGDMTSFPREVAEAALAHKIGDASEQAYRRGDALAKRRRLMQAWADFIATPQRSASVTPIGRGA
jgi:integrase